MNLSRKTIASPPLRYCCRTLSLLLHHITAILSRSLILTAAALRQLCRPAVALFLFTFAYPAAAQPRTGIVYYDLDHLYDTIPALFYNDTDYTPEGRLAWNSERYNSKISQIAATIDSMRMPLVALWSVENESVVRDITAACQGDYTYLHETLNSLDGMDFALLYYGDVFDPHYTEAGRRYLYIEGTLRRQQLHNPHRHRYMGTVQPPRIDTVGIVLCSDTRMAEWVVGDLRHDRPHVKLIVAGRTSTLKAEEYGLNDVLARPAGLGRGNIRRRQGWAMRDRILLDSVFRCPAADVYAKRYLIDQKTGSPIPTYEKRRYKGGTSYALPIFAYME